MKCSLYVLVPGTPSGQARRSPKTPNERADKPLPQILAWIQLRGFGPGFTARLGALMGFSGGPVVDRDGRVMGLTTALPDTGGHTVVAMMTGVDLAGFVGGEQRHVFILDIREAMDEARRMGALPAIRLAGADQTATR